MTKCLTSQTKHKAKESYFCSSTQKSLRSQNIKFDEAELEYMFLTKTMGRKEGLNKETTPTLYANMNNITKLVKYLFLTEQMGWRKGITLFGETKKETVEKKLHQIHDME